MDDNYEPLLEDPLPVRPRPAAGILVIVGVALVLFAGITLAVRSSLAVVIQPPVPGQNMSDLPLTTLDGRSAHLSDYRGRTVLINTWATWCPPCRAEMPYLETYYQQHQHDGFVILAINAGESPATASSFITDNQVTFPVFVDPEEHLMDELHISDYPTSIVVGKDGKVKGVHVGLFTQQALEAEVSPYLK